MKWNKAKAISISKHVKRVIIVISTCSFIMNHHVLAFSIFVLNAILDEVILFMGE